MFGAANIWIQKVVDGSVFIQRLKTLATDEAWVFPETPLKLEIPHILKHFLKALIQFKVINTAAICQFLLLNVKSQSGRSLISFIPLALSVLFCMSVKDRGRTRKPRGSIIPLVRL